MYLPAIDGSPEAVEPRSSAPFDRRARTISPLVEDDDAVRRVGFRVLNGAGYRVVQASTGEEAVEDPKATPNPSIRS